MGAIVFMIVFFSVLFPVALFCEKTIVGRRLIDWVVKELMDVNIDTLE